MLFDAMNCVGCHAAEGGGGMGPPLSDNLWIYGSEPAQIYLTILQGRPNGMPSFAKALPPDAIWQLVSYVRTLSKSPGSPVNAPTHPQQSGK
jgi:cytochrome c oxidase cbb3-type subunit 3